MKRGCFFSSIIFLTIVIGVGFYLYKRYSPQIKNYGRHKIIEMSKNDLDKKINKLEDSIYKDSLKIYIKEQSDLANKGEFETSMKKLGRIFEQAKIFIEDGKLDSIEYKTLKTLAIKNEQPKKN